jgi:hypothetical protein
MKSVTTVLLLLFCSVCCGQSYASLVAEANAHYNNREYEKSISAYKSAFEIERKNPNDLYNGACSAALNGNKELALEWLTLAIKNGWSDINHLKLDADLNALHGSKEWDKLIIELQALADQREANYDKPLQKRLLEIYNDDQIIRREFLDAQKVFGNRSKQVDSLGTIMMHKDSINLIKIVEILDTYGWVGPEKVGGQANQTLFLVIQHSDLETQKKYLPMMREAVKNKKANASALALLEDRVALREGKRQIYGSQIGYDEATNKSFVLPLEDPDNVDMRRASVGLGPISDYVLRWNIHWDVAEYKKQLPEIEAKQAKQK